MTPLQKIQQETEKDFDKKFPLAPISEYIIYSTPQELKSFIHSREAIAYKAGLEGLREKVGMKRPKYYGESFEDSEEGKACEHGWDTALDSVLTLIDEAIKQ